MNIKLDIPVGKYREFTKKELIKLNELLETFKNLISKNFLLICLKDYICQFNPR